MSDEPKKLMNEVLPRPMSFPGTAARARVLNHLRVLTATSAATLTLAACPFVAVDPLPPAPQCRTSRGVSKDVSATVTADGAFDPYADGGYDPVDAGTLPDGGAPTVYRLTFTDTSFSGVTLPMLLTSSNVAAVQYDALNMTVTFAPQDPAQPVQFRFSATCENTAAVVLQATLERAGAGYVVTLTDLP